MHWTRKAVVAGSVAAAAATTALPAHADVVNGGFESGDFSGWTLTGDTGFSGVDALAARSGAFGAFFGPTAPGGISQSFATVANTAYVVSFSLSLVDSSQPNSFSWTWNGAAQTPSFNNASRFSFTDFSTVVNATAASSMLAFTFLDPQSFWLLDTVSVAVVPEPPVTVLLGAGLLSLLAARTRRAKLQRVTGALPA